MVSRGLPQLLGLVVGLLLLLLAEDSLLRGVGAVLVLLTVVGIALVPRMWWRYIRTGRWSRTES